MTLVLIGSRALAIRAAPLLNRKPLDFDFVATAQEAAEWIEANLDKLGVFKLEEYPEQKKLIVNGETAKVEFDLADDPTHSNAQLVELVKSDKASVKTAFGLVPPLDLLFTIKKSHRHKKNSPHFWKTLEDYHRMKAFGAKVRDEYMDFFKLRQKETYNYAHPKLNTNKKNFFAEDQGVRYTYDHDSIHEAVKSFEKSAYRYFAKDGEEVASDKTKFFACPKEIQLASVYEESAVLAIERSLVPHPGVLTEKQAWGTAFSKVLTSIASGWWREFAYEHAYEVLPLYPADYFEQGLAAGVVKPFTGGLYPSQTGKAIQVSGHDDEEIPNF